MLKNNSKYFYLAVFWTITITVLSLITIGDIGKSISIQNKDKYVHFTFYFFFVWFWNSFFTESNPLKNQLLKVLSVAIFFGIIMEVCQELFTINRTADVYDALANTFGATMATIILRTTKHK